MIYRFHIQRGTASSTYDITCDGDLDARRKAETNTACLKVETPSGRVVWRKPLTPAEFRDVMNGTRRAARK